MRKQSKSEFENAITAFQRTIEEATKEGERIIAENKELRAMLAGEPCICKKYEMCYDLDLMSIDSDSGYGRAIIIRFGDKGFYKTTYIWNRAFVDMRNEKLGISKAVQIAMSICSTTGTWSTFADTLETIKVKEKENGDA